MTVATHRPTGRFVVRTPALPFDALSRLCADTAALRTALDDPELAEAVYVASPDLFDRARRWRSGAIADAAVERGLVRYLSRMATRATPFGLFACVGIGALGATTQIEIGGRAARARHTRLDNEYLFALAGQLVQDRRLRGELRWVPNSSLYRLAGRWRYVETVRDDHGRVFRLVAVDDTSVLAEALRLAETGATSAALATALATSHALDPDDSGEFVDELIDAQLLVPAFGPALTGGEPGLGLVRALSATPTGHRSAELLGAAQRQIAALDAAPAGIAIGDYARIATTLQALPHAPDRARLFQVDRFLDGGEVTLGPAVVAEIAAGLDILRRLAPEPDLDDDWGRFRAAFRERYKEREVPLVEVLDDEAGLGFGNSGDGGQAGLLARLEFHDRTARAVRRPARRGSAHLLGLYARAIAEHADEIALSAADLDELAAATPAVLPDSVAVMATLYAESAAAIDEGRFRIRVAQLQGPTATRLLGRFCHGSPAITELVRRIAAEEARLRAPALLAEIVHLPADRAANILLRPVIRDHEIPFLATSGADRDHQIPITDLRVSVIDDRVILRSARLGREIVPLLSSAHHYAARGLGVYRFLCALAEQDLRVGYWDWGDLADAPFLPRVVHGRLELSPAQWTVEAGELAALQRAGQTASRAMGDGALAEARVAVTSEMAALRAARRLPRWVVCAQGDNALTVDLTSAPCIESLLHLVKSQPRARLYECREADGLCARGDGARFAHELVIPWIRTEPRPRATRSRAPVSVERRFAAGAPWLYLKLYGGVANLDATLREAIGPLVAALRAERRIHRWFFVRYRDPDFHLRIRFELDAAELADVQRQLADRIQRVIAAGQVWRVQYDTYEREIDRYGGDRGIVLTEAVFDADSDAVIAIVDAVRGNDDRRWLLALAGMDRLLTDLGLTLAERYQLIAAQRDGLGLEYGMTVAFQRELGVKFRAHQPAIRDALSPGACAHSAGHAALQRRSERLAATVAALREAEAAGRLTVPIRRLADSYIHMHANRVLMTDSRPQELVLYDFLRRHYLEQLHRR